MATNFAFLILPEVHIMDFAGPDQAIHEAIEYGADFKLDYAGINQEVKTSAGMRLGKQKHFSELNLKAGDYLILPGSSVEYLTSPVFKENNDLFSWLRIQSMKKVNLVSICAGTFILAECGLLNGIECTTHFKRTKQVQELYPEAIVRENILFTEDNNIYTSAGIATGIDLILHIIEKLKGSYFTHKVARELLIYTRRDGQSKQHSVFMNFRNHIHSGIHKAQDYIIEHLNRKLSIRQLADIANMSERNFTRIFKRETQVTVSEYINLVRREKIQSLLKNPDLSKLQIAQEVGLESERQIHRIMKKTEVLAE